MLLLEKVGGVHVRGKRMLVFLATMACLVGIGRELTQPHQLPTQANAEALINISTPHDAPIPQEALRLRIIANSDSTKDQNLKLAVRDAIVLQVGALVKNAKSSVQARSILEAHMALLNQMASQVVRDHGYTYAVATTIAKVPFPTKIYGNRIYPAGNYEALRITLGQGLGQNWWCVLYPPLCFVDIADGDAVPNTGNFPDLPPIETLQVKGQSGQEVKVQVRAMALDYGEELWKTASHLWKGVSTSKPA
jgi:stage II sporulation protein R